MKIKRINDFSIFMNFLNVNVVHESPNYLHNLLYPLFLLLALVYLLRWAYKVSYHNHV
jgi:hypothetical protein